VSKPIALVCNAPRNADDPAYHQQVRMTDLTVGSVLGARYHLEHLLGEGGMGAVWAAVDKETGERVALKVLKGKVGPTELRRFMREARAAMAVKHPNVVRVHRVDTCDGLPVMVMDLLKGESLGAFVARRGGVLSLAELSTILLPVLSAVGTAHSMGIVHRDLKPENIFLQRGPHGEVVPLVLDFGIAKLSAHEGEAASTGALTGTGAMLGTPYYMAPEQAFGEKDVDHRADVWALGVLLFQCLSGVRPVDGENIGQLMKVLMTGALPRIHDTAPGLPQDVRDVIARMLIADRTQRCPTLADPFHVLASHTQDAAPSFPSAPPQTPQSFRPSGPMSVLAASVTPGTGASKALVPADEGITGKPVSESVAPVRHTSGAPLVVGAVAVALVLSLAGGGLYLRGRNPAGASTSQIASEVPPQPDSAALDPGPITSTQLRAPVPSASTLPSTSTASLPPVEGRRAGLPKTTASAAPPATLPPLGAPKASANGLPGGMQEAVPF
jgi:eukaryotic-like serine/threonine-protein kinase